MAQLGRPPCDAGVVLAGAPAAPCAASARRWTLVAAILGSGMAFVDGTVVNVALPSLQRSLHADALAAQWVVESYALVLAALLLVGGALGDRHGRRRVFVAGVAVFTGASVACGLAPTVGLLIAARALQGIGAALMVPGSLALISATFPQGERGRAIGLWSAFSGITAAIGPLVGGALVDRFDWRWAFLVNAPLGAALLVLCLARVPESRAPGAPRVDAPGALLATVGLAGVTFAFVEAPGRGWGAPAVWGAATLGVGALLLFVRVQARSREPMLPLGLFRRRDFTGANVLTLLLYAALAGAMFYLPLVLVQVHGYSATAAGAATLPFVAILFLLSGPAGRLVDRHGARLPLVAGPTLAAAGFALLAVPGTRASYLTGFLPAVCVLGLGMAVTVAPLTTTVMNAVGDEMAGVASGVNNAVSRVAGVLAIAVLGVLMAASFESRLADGLGALPLAPAQRDDILSQRHRLGAIEVPAAWAQRQAVQGAVDDAFVTGFRHVSLACAVLALLGAAGAWRWIGRETGRRAAPSTPG